jgi:hypothetical protein
MRTLPFTVLDLAAGLLWALPMASLGYYAAGALDPLLGGVRRYEVALAVALVAAVATLLALRSVRRAVRWRELRVADLHAVVPFAIGLLGVLNLLSAIWPREPAMMRDLAHWLPLEVTQRSRAVMLLAGLALLQVTRNLGRRKSLAWGVRGRGALGVARVAHPARLRPPPLAGRGAAARLPARLPLPLHGAERPRLAAAGVRDGAGAGAHGLDLRARRAHGPAAALPLGPGQHAGVRGGALGAC